jgi:hypothetical protein
MPAHRAMLLQAGIRQPSPPLRETQSAGLNRQKIGGEIPLLNFECQISEKVKINVQRCLLSFHMTSTASCNASWNAALVAVPLNWSPEILLQRAPALNRIRGFPILTPNFLPQEGPR